jgi:hypothetical protein
MVAAWIVFHHGSYLSVVGKWRTHITEDRLEVGCASGPALDKLMLHVLSNRTGGMFPGLAALELLVPNVP